MDLTSEDADKLERAIQAREGAPFQLGIEHYFELCKIPDEVVRSWYEYKAAYECLSLRGLRQIIREDLFGEIIGRPVPPILRKKVKERLREPSEEIPLTPKGEASYQTLVTNIGKIFQEVEAKGIPMRHVRHDILECCACGAYEDYLLEGPLVRTAFDHSGNAIAGEFQVVKRSESSHELEVGGMRCVIDYEFICGDCGAYQKARVEEDF